MKLTKNEDAAQQLHQAFIDDTPLPSALSNVFSINSAYATQFQLLRLRQDDGAEHVGWKVGLTAAAMQTQQGVNEPCLGHLLKSGHLQSPAEIPFGSLHAPGFENELCIRLKAPLSGPDLSLEAVALAIESVAPALEIIEKRGVFGEDFPLSVASNVQQRAFVTGAFMPFSAHTDLSLVEVSVTVNDKNVAVATGAEVLGTPLESIRWLAGKLAGFNRCLEAGTLIMTGSFTQQFVIEPGDCVAAEFSSFGVARAVFQS